MNGRLPGGMLGTILGTGQELRADLLPQTMALRAAFQYEFGKPLTITDGYRSYDEQVAVFQRYYTTVPQPGRPTRVWNGRIWWQRPGFPSAAVPGTSNHGLAVAVDLGSGVNTSLLSREHLWMRAVGGRYGFTHPSWAHDHVDQNGTDEPWHFEAIYVTPDNYDGGTAAPVPVPEEDDMAGATEILAAIAGVQATVNNIERILTVDGGNGIRGDVQATQGEAKATHADLLTGINELRALATDLGHPTA